MILMQTTEGHCMLHVSSVEVKQEVNFLIGHQNVNNDQNIVQVDLEKIITEGQIKFGLKSVIV